MIAYFNRHKSITRFISILCLCLIVSFSVPSGFFVPDESHAVAGVDDIFVLLAVGSLLVSAGVLLQSDLDDAAAGVAGALDKVKAASMSFLNWVTPSLSASSPYQQILGIAEGLRRAYTDLDIDFSFSPSSDLKESVSDYISDTVSGSVLPTGIYTDDSYNPNVIYNQIQVLPISDFSSNYIFYITPTFALRYDTYQGTSSGVTSTYGRFSVFNNFTRSWVVISSFTSPVSSYSSVGFRFQDRTIYDETSFYYRFRLASSLNGSIISGSYITTNNPNSLNSSSYPNFTFGFSSSFSDYLLSYDASDALFDASTITIPLDYNVDPDALLPTALGSQEVFNAYGDVIRVGAVDQSGVIDPDIPIDGTWPGALEGELDTTAGTDGEVLDPNDNLVYKIPFIGWLADLLSSLWDLIKSGFNRIGQWLKAIWDKITSIISAVVDLPVNIFNQFSGKLNDILDKLQEILEAILSFILDLGDILIDFLAFLSGYTLFQTLFSHFLPAAVYLPLWAFWLCAVAIGLFRTLVNR